MIKKKKTLYCILDSFGYKDGVFGAGFVKNSIHPIDRIFLFINDNIFELRDDEIYAIISALSKALWCDYQYDKNKKIKLKWHTIEELRKKWNSLKNK